MRRIFLLSLGILQLCLAAFLFLLGRTIPRDEDVAAGFQRAERVTRNAGAQVRILHGQVQDLRRPQVEKVAARLQAQTRTVTGMLRSQQMDFETVKVLRDSLKDAAAGLESSSAVLDPAHFSQMGQGLGETADFLARRVAPAADQAADSLEEATAALKKDAELLRLLLDQAPLDLKAARQIHDSLGKFGEGLERMNTILKPQKLEVMREGFRGMDESLSTGAEQVEKLASYTYPVVEFRGWRPEVNQRPFWPEGGTIAAGLRKAAAGVKAVAEEMDGAAADLPRFHESLAESRQVIQRTREALAAALKQKDKLEPVLRDVPAHAARLAETLPRIGTDLARVLRETEKMKSLAGSLREAQKGIDAAVARWPDLRMSLSRSAELLRTSARNLDRVLQNRDQYNAAVQQTTLLGESFAAMLPLLTDHLDYRLDEQEQALVDLQKSLDEAGAVLPAYGQAAGQLLQVGRILTWLVALIVGLHGVYMALTATLGPRGATP